MWGRNSVGHPAGRQKGELVSFASRDGWKLEGILFEAPSSRWTVIHVHGSMGNFYADQFVRVMASTYAARNISLLAFNTRCHDCVSEGYSRDDEFRYVGGSLSHFDTCVDDLAGAVEFVEGLSSEVILQGYSLGCDRIVSYVLSAGVKFRSILLSPCDSYEIQRIWLEGSQRSVEFQRSELSKLPPGDDSQLTLLPFTEYGVRMNGEFYENPISVDALKSIVNGPPFSLFNLAESPRYFIDAPALVYIGRRDPLQTSKCDMMLSYLEERFQKISPLVSDEGDHCFTGQELEIARAIADWIRAEGTANVHSL